MTFILSPGLRLHPSTLEWLQAKFKLPLLFLESIVNVSKWAKIGNGCFVQHNEAGDLEVLGRLLNN